jgi:hypothetical protein
MVLRQRPVSLFVGTTPMKVDQEHMTAEYADRLAPIIREYLTAAEIGFPEGS